MRYLANPNGGRSHFCEKVGVSLMCMCPPPQTQLLLEYETFDQYEMVSKSKS